MNIKIRTMRFYKIEKTISIAEYVRFHESVINFSNIPKGLRNDTIARASETSKGKPEVVSYVGYDGSRYMEYINGANTVGKVAWYIHNCADNYAAKLSENADMLIDDMQEYWCTTKGLSRIKLYL